MPVENTKKVVIIKDIKSRYVEEAILILRKNIQDIPEQEQPNAGNIDSDFLVKEAQRIIDEYIVNCKRNARERRKLLLDKDFNFRKPYINKIINIALISSAALFIYLLIRFI